MASANEVGPSVRVRLQANLQRLLVSGQNISLKEGESVSPVAIPQNFGAQITRVNVVQTQGKKQWMWKSERQSSLGSSRFELSASPYLFLTGISLQMGSKSLPSKLILKANQDKFDVIGVLPLEDYLVGVIASEMPLSWPMEALKAQAIAARSYTLVTMAERSKQVFHLESGIQDQVFRHVVQGFDHDPLVERAFQAVKETAGVRLIKKSTGKILKAYYHASCGGRTSTTKQVWGYDGNKDSLGESVVDSSCPVDPKSHWTLKLNRSLIEKKIQGLVGVPQLGSFRLAGLSLVGSGKESRAESVLLKLGDGRQVSILADRFRSALGYGELKSTQFNVELSNDEFVFHGRGLGHGVGLCQWGSRTLARQKKTASEILAHYYPSAILR